MSIYKPLSRHLRLFIVGCVNIKDLEVLSHRTLSKTYEEAVITKRLFQHVKDGDFHIEDRYSGRREVSEDVELEA